MFTGCGALFCTCAASMPHHTIMPDLPATTHMAHCRCGTVVLMGRRMHGCSRCPRFCKAKAGQEACGRGLPCTTQVQIPGAVACHRGDPLPLSESIGATRPRLLSYQIQRGVVCKCSRDCTVPTQSDTRHVDYYRQLGLR